MAKRAADPIAVEIEDLYPRDEAHRYRIYTLEPCHVCTGTGFESTDPEDASRCGNCRGAGSVPKCRRAAATKGGVGLAIFDLAEEDGEPRIVAVNDAIERRWITTLWPPKKETTR